MYWATLPVVLSEAKNLNGLRVALRRDGSEARAADDPCGFSKSVSGMPSRRDLYEWCLGLRVFDT